MHHVVRARISDERRRLLARVDEWFRVARLPGYVLVDDDHHTGFANPRYRELRAFYLNVASAGRRDPSPRYVYDILCRDDCEHFIWLSRRVAEAPLAQFVWIYAHEVQHLVQRRSNPLCARANGLIRAAYGRTDGEAKLQLEFPCELDAELAARAAVRDLLGGDVLLQYVQDQCRDPVGQAYFRRFREREDEWKGLALETAATLRARRDELRSLQAELADEEFLFDLDDACEALSSSRGAAKVGSSSGFGQAPDRWRIRQ